MSGSRIGRWPVMTGAAVAIAVVAAVVQYAVPGAVPVLRRDPGGLRHGELWRLVTPLLVQTLGWYQVVVNLVTLAAAGVVAERVLGRRLWLVLFAAGTAGGQVAAYAWHEPGGGDSIAICGLAGGAAVMLLAGRSVPPRAATEVTVFYVAALAGWGVRGAVGAALTCLVAALALYGLRRVGLPGVHRLALAGTVACALGLLVLRDLHGASLTAAMACAAALLLATRARQPAVPS